MNGLRAGETGRTERRGHTLVELVLVLTILALLAVVAVPRMASLLLRSRLHASLDAVRADLNFARARAISTGLRHQFVVAPETGEIVVQPVRLDQAAAAGAATTLQEVPPALTDQLPQEVRIADWTVIPLSTGGTLPGAQQGAQDGAPLVFYPEGTGDSAQIVLEDTSGDRRAILIDGYTGEIREGTEEELAQR